MNPVASLAYWFVTEFSGREWTPAHYRSREMRDAKTVLREYGAEDVKACLFAMRDGILGYDLYDTGINCLYAIYWGTPPFIDRWRVYKTTPPAKWEIESYRQWETRTAKFREQVSVPSENQDASLTV